MAEVRMFGPVRVAAGASREAIDAPTVERLLSTLVTRHGPDFGALLTTCAIYVNGERAESNAHPLTADDEVALLPPVSGGGA